MSSKEDEFLESLRATFRVEAAEHLQTIATGLLDLEKASAPEAQRSLIAIVFRAAHSLKGAARAADFTAVESLCQSLEEVFASWKRQKKAPTSSTFDVAHRALDAIAAAISEPEASLSVSVPVARSSFDQPIPSPDGFTPGAAVVASHAPNAERKTTAAEETVRIAVSKLDARLVEAEEMLAVKLTIARRAEDLGELAQSLDAWRNEWAAVEPEARALRQAIDRQVSGRANQAPSQGLARLLAFVEWSVDHHKSLETKVATVTRTVEQDRHVIGKLVDELLEDSKKLLLLPFASLAAPLPKLVRDLCRDQGKEADLAIQGDDVEIDKRILEEMKDPLIHLLRNCVDHAIEPAEQRVRLGKNPRGTITIAVSQLDGSKVEILVSDDGAGINSEKVKHSAIKHTLLSADDASQLADAQALELIFQPEVSTSPMITRLSGRGLGLAIVREKAAKLGGTVSVESKASQGTSFRVILPSMLATFRGILIEASGRLFVVPTLHVERVARVRKDDIQTVEGRETIVLSERAIALVRLADVLDLPEASANGEFSAGTSVVVLGMADQRIAFVVDAVLDEQEVLVKRLRKPLSRVRHIAGATVLGSGQVAPVLNVADLLKTGRKFGRATVRLPAATPTAPAKAVLVVEDSITSRILLKSILESAGYKVKTAVDGMEAFTLLRTETFDLVVTDVEMPRLNGFDLTARIRANKKLAELPVVLVTALETREDRERGVDVGANAYLVKSGFDQSNLIDAVRQLI